MNRFQPNPRLKQELAASREIVGALGERGAKIRRKVEQIGPVGKSRPGKHYVDMIRVVSDRSGVRVTAEKFTSRWIEFGTVHTPMFAPLRRGAEAAGFQVRA